MELKKHLSTILGLSSRALERPDGRPLYSYRLQKEEFDLLQRALRDKTPGSIDWDNYIAPAYVIYASEWWRLHYSGGPWRWDDVDDSLNWEKLDANHRPRWVREGLKYWQRPIHKYQGGQNAYLMTLVTEGGFPIGLIERGSHLLRYLKAVLKDYTLFSAAGMDKQRIASSHLSRLPKSFRREEVAQMAADLIEVLYDLGQITRGNADPVAVLNREKPGWEANLPFAIDGEAAESIIKALLKVAATRIKSDGQHLKVSRWFKVSAEGELKHQASIELPSSIPFSILEAELGLKPDQLKRRFSLAVIVEGKFHKVANLMKEDGVYEVFAYSSDAQKLSIDPAAAIHAVLLDPNGARASERNLPVLGGNGIDPDLPITCYLEDDELNVLSQGTCRSRFDELYIYLPDTAIVIEGNTASVGEFQSTELANGQWLILQEKIKIQLPGGFKCSVRPRSETDSSMPFIMTGSRQYAFETGGVPVYRGSPGLMGEVNGLFRKVVDSDVFWSQRSNADQWFCLQAGAPLGLVRLRVVRDGEIAFSSTVTVLPVDFHLKPMATDNTNHGSLKVSGLEDGFFVSGVPDRVAISVNAESNDIEIACDAAESYFGRFPLHIKWSSGAECELSVPFPGRGAKFVHVDGQEYRTNRIPVSQLHEVSAIGIAPAAHEHFTLQGELRARDIGTGAAKGTLVFSERLQSSGGGFNELSLVDIYSKIKQLFAYSADLDAYVRLEILKRASVVARIDVVQFSSFLEYDREKGLVVHYDNEEKPCSDIVPIRLLNFQGDEELEPDGDFITADDGHAWQLSLPDDESSLYLAVASDSRIRSIRPSVVYAGPKSGQDDRLEEVSETYDIEAQSLGEIFAITSRASRIYLIEKFLSGLAEVKTHEPWSDLLKVVRRFGEVHPDAIDLYEEVIEFPEIVVGLLLRASAGDVAMLSDWEDYLPFFWSDIPIASYLGAFDQFKTLCDGDPDFGSLLLDHAKNNIAELIKRGVLGKALEEVLKVELLEMPAEGVFKVARALAQQGRTKLAQTFYAHASKSVDVVLQVAGESHFPEGITRQEWEKLFGQESLWLDDKGARYRRPFLDAASALSYCLANGIYLEKEYRVFISSMRQFQPDGFDSLVHVLVILFYFNQS